MGTQRARVALWKADILQIQRRQRIKRATALVCISALVFFVVVVLGIKHGWGFMLTSVSVPRWVAECFHAFPCPGVFIALLGFVAAGVTLRKEPTKPEKAFWLTSPHLR